MRRHCTVAAAALTLLACSGTTNTPAAECAGATTIAALPAEIPEASGIAPSRRQSGTFWVHNDSRRTPRLYAIDSTGRLLASASLPVTADPDWEDIAAGPCPARDCLYLADIGDNLHQREDRAILRFPEPDLATPAIGDVEPLPIRFPDRPHDAEAIFVMPDTSLYIITKGRNGPVTVYRYPPPLRPHQPVTLEPVQQLTAGLEQLPDQVTGAAASPDGARVAVRTYSHLQLYRFAGDTLAPLIPGRGYSLAALQEPQGEGVALVADGTVFLVSETGPARGAAPFSRLGCHG
jgi:hypothetical protein